MKRSEENTAMIFLLLQFFLFLLSNQHNLSKDYVTVGSVQKKMEKKKRVGERGKGLQAVDGWDWKDSRGRT